MAELRQFCHQCIYLYQYDFSSLNKVSGANTRYNDM